MMMFFVFFFFPISFCSAFEARPPWNGTSPLSTLSLSSPFPLNKPFFFTIRLLRLWTCSSHPAVMCESIVPHIFPMLQKQWTSLSAKQILGLWEGWLELEGSRGYEPGGEANQAPLLSVDVRAQGIDTFFITMDYLRGAWLPLLDLAVFTSVQHRTQGSQAQQHFGHEGGAHQGIFFFFWLTPTLEFGQGARK